MREIKYITHEEAIQREWRDPEYRRAYRLQKPRFDILRALLRFRRKLGITQKQLAKNVGTHQSRISKIESAELDVRLSTLTRIADALDADVRIELVPRLSDDFYSEILELSARPTDASQFLNAEPAENMEKNEVRLSEDVFA